MFFPLQLFNVRLPPALPSCPNALTYSDSVTLIKKKKREKKAESGPQLGFLAFPGISIQKGMRCWKKNETLCVLTNTQFLLPNSSPVLEVLPLYCKFPMLRRISLILTPLNKLLFQLCWPQTPDNLVMVQFIPARNQLELNQKKLDLNQKSQSAEPLVLA